MLISPWLHAKGMSLPASAILPKHPKHLKHAKHLKHPEHLKHSKHHGTRWLVDLFTCLLQYIKELGDKDKVDGEEMSTPKRQNPKKNQKNTLHKYKNFTTFDTHYYMDHSN